jgi:hypothetical protein
MPKLLSELESFLNAYGNPESQQTLVRVPLGTITEVNSLFARALQ